MFAIQGRLHRNYSPPKYTTITRFTSTQIPTTPTAVSTATITYSPHHHHLHQKLDVKLV
jgi:hypothetical protein